MLSYYGQGNGAEAFHLAMISYGVSAEVIESNTVMPKKL